jgi:hypothetical protein
VPGPKLQQKTVTPKANGFEVTPDAGYDGLSNVAVNPVQTIGQKITANGTYTPSYTNYFFSSVTVDVQPKLQTKTATENGTVTPDDGYDGLSEVWVRVPQDVIDVTELPTEDIDQDKIYRIVLPELYSLWFNYPAGTLPEGIGDMYPDGLVGDYGELLAE